MLSHDSAGGNDHLNLVRRGAMQQHEGKEYLNMKTKSVNL
jgi:hypothetical protein